MDWLGVWEPIEAPGRHSRMEPAGFALGYQYRDPDMVIRAIPVDGYIGKGWSRSPQVRFWLQEEKKTILERIKEWLFR